MSNKRFINTILILTTLELLGLIYGLFQPLNIDGIGAYGMKSYTHFFIALILHILVGIAYLHRFWLAAFLSINIAIFSEFFRSRLAIQIGSSFDIQVSLISSFIILVEIALFSLAIVLIYKFKRIKYYPPFLGFLRDRTIKKKDELQ